MPVRTGFPELLCASRYPCGHHNIILTPEEKKVFGQLFQAADNEGLGVVTGELAVKFFEKSGLSPRILGEIWGIADTENRGLLDKVGFSVALRLIGQAQNGQHPRPELAQQPGPLPRFEGVNIVYPPPATASPPPPAGIPTQPTGPTGGMIRVPPLIPQDVEKFTLLFEKSGATDGLLQGSVARDIFQRSRLPTANLIQIWNLADRQGRGALNCSEFVVAMHLITCCKNGSLPVLPQILPPGLYDAAAGRPPTRSGPDRRAPGGRPMPPMPPIPKQFSGPQAQRAQSPLSRNFTPPVPQPANAIQRDLTGGGWVVSPADKQRFDAVFLTVDKAGRGVITGEEAVPFFSNSGLPEDALAQIWDLADINKAGQLNRDEFAIAMYLIVQQRSNPGTPLPEVLPPNLVPPSMRQQQRAMAGSPDDLFGLDSFSSAGPGPSSTATAGPFEGDMFGSKEASPAVSAGHSPVPPQGPSFLNRPTPTFVPQSSFATGGSNHSGRGGFAQPPKPDMDDLLGDADPEVSKQLTNESTELANLSNQIGSLTKQTQELNIKRVSAESDLSNLTTQKQHIEAQLAQLRAAYEKEAAQVNRVEEQLAISRQETAKATQEYHKLDAEYNQLQYKLQELSSQLDADKRENENLKERMNSINAENRQLREELERVQMQARRERGMVAINKKQVEKSEQERDKLKASIEDASRPQSAAGPHPPGSPTLSQSSVTGSHNPFHARKSPPIPENPAFAPSPFGPINDVFGPGPFSSTPPPQTPFAPRNAADSSTYTPSATESGHGGRSTPTTSAPPSSYHGSPPPAEAPPPAVDAQMTSAFLPLPGINRTDSLSSSVQVNAAASVRNTDQFQSRPDTPTNAFGTATVETPGREKREDRSGSFSMKSDAGTEASGRPAFTAFDRRIDSPFSQVERNNTGGTSGGDEPRKLEKSDSYYGSAVPGSFPSAEPSNPIKATPTGDSMMSNQSRRSNLSRSAFGDPFNLGKDDARASSRQDFDDAFSKYAAVEHHTGGSGSISASKFNDEFPPIQEVRPDSDSDSEGEVGFEDNFTTASPMQTKPKLTSGTPSNAATESPSAPPPAASAQASPPGYGTEKPYEFGGLLPSRTDPMKHDALTPGGSANAVVFPSVPNAATTTAKDDVDDFGTSSAFDDFNPVFESRNTASAPGMAISDDNDFDQFTFNVGGPAHGQSNETAAQGKQQPASAQDWDAIFANFGDQPQQQQQPQAGMENVPTAGANGMSDQSGMDPGEGGVSLSSSDHHPSISSSAAVGTATEGGVKVAAGGNDEKVEKLTGMGFDRESSVKALQKHGWDIDRVWNAPPPPFPPSVMQIAD
ncbi:hypothetical protein FN846DRAFT_900891 [Sphaerosporella brunnea]|uniref:Cytoskeletal adapter protein sagA n=1 Tax=Sphaerosporella brunnea TaxID=1250544 RepID=A0A5J5EFM9_9PEZI|nr:hypothetical protein FN846DRAFT_900891 [Sphaerosporella brunnea]